MNIRGEDSAPTTPQTVYVKDGITYLPSYKDEDVFVGPGYKAIVTKPDGKKQYYPPEYTRSYLIEMGAVETYTLLWPRRESGDE
jgi:hypothetical protein